MRRGIRDPVSEARKSVTGIPDENKSIAFRELTNSWSSLFFVQHWVVIDPDIRVYMAILFSFHRPRIFRLVECLWQNFWYVSSSSSLVVRDKQNFTNLLNDFRMNPIMSILCNRLLDRTVLWGKEQLTLAADTHKAWHNRTFSSWCCEKWDEMNNVCLYVWCVWDDRSTSASCDLMVYAMLACMI